MLGLLVSTAYSGCHPTDQVYLWSQPDGKTTRPPYKQVKSIIDVIFSMERDPITSSIVDLMESGYKVDPVALLTRLYRVSYINTETATYKTLVTTVAIRDVFHRRQSVTVHRKPLGVQVSGRWAQYHVMIFSNLFRACGLAQSLSCSSPGSETVLPRFLNHGPSDSTA